MTTNDLTATSSLVFVFPEGVHGVIFDCDGVMINSCDANIGYYNLLLKLMGKPPLTPEQAKYAQMATSYQAVAQVMTQEELARLPELTRQYPYRKVALPLLKEEPGFMELIQFLYSRHVRLAIHTNRGQGIWDVLDRLQVRAYFDVVMTVDQATPKPDPDGVFQILDKWKLKPGQVAFVGDSDTDCGAARGAGVPFIAYGNPGLAADWHASSHHCLQQNFNLLL